MYNSGGCAFAVRYQITGESVEFGIHPPSLCVTARAEPLEKPTLLCLLLLAYLQQPLPGPPPYSNVKTTTPTTPPGV